MSPNSTGIERRNAAPEPSALWVDGETLFRVDHDVEGTSLPPVSVAVAVTRASLYTYLTPDEADQLADALKAHAAYAREQEAGGRTG